MALVSRLPAHDRQRVVVARCTDCGWYKSWLFTRIEPDMGFVNVRATMLDDATWFALFVETCRSEALSWAKTDAPRSYAHLPPMEIYSALIARFASANASALVIPDLIRDPAPRTIPPTAPVPRASPQ